MHAKDEDAADAELFGDEEGASSASSARLELQLSGAPARASFRLASSPTDEFVRVGEVVTITLPAWLLWEVLYPSEPVPDDTRLEQLTATVDVHFHDKAARLGGKSLVVESFTSTLYGTYGETAPFVIPDRTGSLSFALTIKDGQKKATLGRDQVAPISVFGGDLPDKTLLFDNMIGGVLRQRVIEGGSLSVGARVTLSYTEWRADQVVDKTNINTQVGVEAFNAPAGASVRPFAGKLVHDVYYRAQFNDAQGWRPETQLTPNPSSALSFGGTNFEATLTIPAGVTVLELYFHVQTYLVAEYSKDAKITARWRKENERVLMRDKYDNPFGPETNFSFPIR
jgi:hypothetical protein